MKVHLTMSQWQQHHWPVVGSLISKRGEKGVHRAGSNFYVRLTHTER